MIKIIFCLNGSNALNHTGFLADSGWESSGGSYKSIAVAAGPSAVNMKRGPMCRAQLTCIRDSLAHAGHLLLCPPPFK